MNAFIISNRKALTHTILGAVLAVILGLSFLVISNVAHAEIVSPDLLDTSVGQTSLSTTVSGSFGAPTHP